MRLMAAQLLVLLFLLNGTSAAQAGNLWHQFWDAFRDTHRWPKPLDTVDRHNVRAVWKIMQDNGWKLQNTLGDHLFKGRGQDLTATGKKRVRWIAAQATRKRRQIFVLRGENDFVTQRRIDSVQAELVDWNTNQGATPRIRISDRQPPAESGMRLHQMHREFQESQPAPRLPALSANAPAN
ncbi:MAG: hypothetical protein VX346_11140 [Planctomycetota bacterium]|nr:hypothetical protein [Planctomycetota bacterium]